VIALLVTLAVAFVAAVSIGVATLVVAVATAVEDPNEGTERNDD
jgi:hypothetical protein